MTKFCPKMGREAYPRIMMVESRHENEDIFLFSGHVKEILEKNKNIYNNTNLILWLGIYAKWHILKF